MPDNVARLLKLAEAEFPDLTAPEREVVRCAAKGVEADLAQWGPHSTVGDERKTGGGPLRSGVVTWLCTDERAKRKVHRKGVFIIYATLDAQLDLLRANVPFFFGLHACRLPGLDAQRARFSDNLYLKLCHIEGILNIHSSRIGGQLLCDGALVQGTNGVSVRADEADIGGTAFLSGDFKAVGEVRLLGAKIRGQLNCKQGVFQNPNDKALNLDSADIENEVLLSEDFHAEGQVRMLGAKIKGQLNCDNGTFLNENGIALNLQGALVSDALFLEPTLINGLICLYNTEVQGTLRMDSTSTVKASLDLRGAKVGILYDSRDSWPEAGMLKLDGFVYGDFFGTSPRNAAERLEWLGRMPNAQFLPQPYEQLAAWFQKSGHDSEAREVRIAKEQKRSEFFINPFKSVWWELKHIVVGHGYKPYLAIYWLLGLIMLGSSVYTLNLDNMTPSVSYNLNATNPVQGSAALQASDYPDLNTLLYSTDVALPIVDLQQEHYWMPNSSKPEGRFLWWFNWAEVLLGWFLASMGIAGATGIIRKD